MISSATAAVQNVGDTLLQLLTEVLLFLPRVISAAIILLIGYIVARIVRTLLTKGLRAVKFDQIADRAGVSAALKKAGTKLDAAAVLATVVYWWIFLTFIDMAVNSLGLTTITTFVTAVLNYLPNVFVAILILIIGSLLANVVSDVVRGAAAEAGLNTAGLLATIARWAILVLAGMAALTQLNVAQTMIFILFTAVVGMLALAGGLAFGLGGADAARSLIAGQTMGSLLQPGQKVQIGDKNGTVVRHDMNSTVLDEGDGQMISIPNGILDKERVTLIGGKGGNGAPQRAR